MWTWLISFLAIGVIGVIGYSEWDDIHRYLSFRNSSSPRTIRTREFIGQLTPEDLTQIHLSIKENRQGDLIMKIMKEKQMNLLQATDVVLLLKRDLKNSFSD